MQPVETPIGLGAVDPIDRLTIRWPTGKLQEFTGLPVNVTITITGGSSELQVGALKRS